MRGRYDLALEGLRAKPHFASKQVTNDQDCFGCVQYPGDHDRSTIAYTVELIEVSHREVVGFRGHRPSYRSVTTLDARRLPTFN
jgi:hypothetical protein